MASKLASTETRFLDKLSIGVDNDCWLWTGCTRGVKSYGFLRVDGKNLYAHRLAYKFYCGDIPKDMYVLHKCDNPMCCNPNHLFLGSPQDNMTDMVNKKRSLTGERNHKAKLTENDISDIRFLFGMGVAVTTLAKEYGVATTQIRYIKYGKTWKHV